MLVFLIWSNSGRKCLESETGDILLQTLSRAAKRALSGLTLNLSNIKELSSKLPEQDQHLLIPPPDLIASDLYDIMHIVQVGRTPGQAQRLFSLLIMKYYDIDRNLRVSSSNYFEVNVFNVCQFLKSVFSMESTKISNQIPLLTT